MISEYEIEQYKDMVEAELAQANWEYHSAHLKTLLGLLEWILGEKASPPDLFPELQVSMMGFKITDTHEWGGHEYETVKCSRCGHVETIHSDQDFPAECMGCLTREYENEY